MERAIEGFVVVNFVVIGLSHLLASRAWGRYFDWLRSLGEPGVFLLAGATLAFGSFIVAFHNVWQGWPLLITIVGWGHVVKATLYFCFPALGLKMIGRVREESAGVLIWGGAVMLIVSAFLAWRLWWS